MEVTQPFFSIGITTFNRNDLLKEVLISLINQDFSDFEIIVGNDFLAKPISQEIIGINDSRIRIINNEKNLGELGNMNSLLNQAKGKYFSWIFDDDLCAPDYLGKSYYALKKYNFPKCVFSSFYYIYVAKIKISNRYTNDTKDFLLSGSEFLRQYLSGAIRVLGLGGFHDTDYLCKLGGVTKLTDGHMALYSEYLLILQDSLLPGIAYIDAELIGNRVHTDSYSNKSTDVEYYKQSGINLIKYSLKILTTNELINDFERNLKSLLKSVVSVVITKSRLSGYRISKKEITNYINGIKEEFVGLNDKNLIIEANRCLSEVKNQVFLFRIKSFIKMVLPIKYLQYAHIILSYVSKYTNKSF